MWLYFINICKYVLISTISIIISKVYFDKWASTIDDFVFLSFHLILGKLYITWYNYLQYSSIQFKVSHIYKKKKGDSCSDNKLIYFEVSSQTFTW
jgi:hypothetical protein